MNLAFENFMDKGNGLFLEIQVFVVSLKIINRIIMGLIREPEGVDFVVAVAL